jgi:hypothetical protein
MWRDVASGRAFSLAGCLAMLGCSHDPRGGARSGPAPAADRASSDAFVGPARFVPDVTPASAGLVDVLPDGSRRFIVSGIRVIDHPDGTIERAREVLPSGVARVQPLPSRIGGGLVVYIVSSNGTQLWRAKTWLGSLEPLAETWGAIDDVAPGFDRLYVRSTGGDLRALDPESGRQVSLGPLPPATRIRALAFADAWRAVAIVDYRGALATFDAGNTWRTIPFDGMNVNQVSLRDGDFLLDTPRGRFALGPSGELSRDEALREIARLPLPYPTEPPSSDATTPSAAWDPRGLGMRPVRAAVEGGWPVTTSHGERAAVFADGGALYRVGLETGALLETRRGAFRDDDGPCHAIALGRGFGFVCGAQAGPTTVYAAEPSLEIREVVRFATPRAIVASGNGGFVVRGACARDAPPTVGATSAFCSFSPSGEERQWGSTALAFDELPWIRPVVLRDGRAVFVLPPTDANSGRLFVSRGGEFDVVPLAFDDPRVGVRRAYLLEGIEEREPGVLGAWLLTPAERRADHAGGEELRGARIALDGKVTLGRTSAPLDRTVVAGRFGFDWAGTGRGFETIDGGLSWTPVDLPAFDPSRTPRPVAACGPVGCARDNWLRIGWGRVAEATDLVPARAPERSRVALTPPRGVALRCQPTGEVTGPAAPPPSKLPVEAPKTKVKPLPRGAGPIVVQGLPRGTFAPYPPPSVARPPVADLRISPAPGTGPAWSPFRGHAPPAVGSGDVALEAGTDAPMTAQARIYTWGVRGAEWAHSGHVQVRFDDRFDISGTRSTAVTAPPWADEDRASDALGLTAGQPVNWTSLLDPSGEAAVLVGQRGGGRADLIAAAAGEPLSFWRDVDNGPLPVPTSVVRAGATWFFLQSAMAQNTWATTVYRVEGGVVRRLARLPRIPVPAGEFAPKLMRRARSKGLGLLVQGAPGFDQVIRDWYVLPLDPDTGELDEPVRLYGSDLEGRIPETCSDERDGWMVNTELSLAPAVRVVPTPVNVSSIELRLRLDPGSVCVEAIAARSEGLVASSNSTTSGPKAAPSNTTAGGAKAAPSNTITGDVPLAATDTTSGRRWLLRCGL